MKKRNEEMNVVADEKFEAEKLIQDLEEDFPVEDVKETVVEELLDAPSMEDELDADEIVNIMQQLEKKNPFVGDKESSEYTDYQKELYEQAIKYLVDVENQNERRKIAGGTTGEVLYADELDSIITGRKTRAKKAKSKERSERVGVLDRVISVVAKKDKKMDKKMTDIYEEFCKSGFEEKITTAATETVTPKEEKEEEKKSNPVVAPENLDYKRTELEKQMEQQKELIEQLEREKREFAKLLEEEKKENKSLQEKFQQLIDKSTSEIVSLKQELAVKKAEAKQENPQLMEENKQLKEQLQTIKAECEKAKKYVDSIQEIPGVYELLQAYITKQNRLEDLKKWIEEEQEFIKNPTKKAEVELEVSKQLIFPDEEEIQKFWQSREVSQQVDRVERDYDIHNFIKVKAISSAIALVKEILNVNEDNDYRSIINNIITCLEKQLEDSKNGYNYISSKENDFELTESELNLHMMIINSIMECVDSSDSLYQLIVGALNTVKTQLSVEKVLERVK